jgi:single-strand DNA-binding protein
MAALAQDFMDWENSVTLVARVTSEAEQFELPSGDVLTRFRVVVPRDKPTTKATVDTIDCVSFKIGVSKKAMKLFNGEVVELQGQLRRRFWKTGAGVASRMEVEVSGIAIIKLAA